MMNYEEMVKRSPKKSEAQMWRSVSAISKFVEEVDECCPDIVRAFMINEYEQMYGGHFNEEMAMEEVGKMHHDDREGRHISGEIVTFEESRKIVPNGDSTLMWDAYVGANGLAHDLGRSITDKEEILKLAYEYWFSDDDFDDGRGRSKVWWYYSSK